MRSLEEDYLLVHALSKGEKRLVKLLGRAKSGSQGSAHLQLFDWLLDLKAYQQSKAEASPFLKGLGAGLPTVCRRMRSMVMGTLVGVAHSKSPLVKLDQAVFAARLLVQRRLFKLAHPVIQQGLDLAMRFGQYEKASEFFHFKRTLLMVSAGAGTADALEELAEEQALVQAMAMAQQRLHHLHALAKAFQLTGVSGRTQASEISWSRIMEELGAVQADAGSDLRSRSLLGDLRGQFLIAQGKGTEALAIYTDLIGEWREQAVWINEFPAHYIQLFRNYQRSIFFGTWDEAVLNTYLLLLPPTHSLPSSFRLDFQRINFSHQLTLGLNQARFDLLIPQLCEEVSDWLQEHRNSLNEAVRMAFYYNIAIAYFLAGHFRDALHVVRILLNWKRGTARQDIRHFVRVLEVILLYELEESDLNTYVERRSRRYLKQQPFQMEFETSVLNYLRQLQNQVQTNIDAGLQLAGELKALVEKTARPTPMLGLFEVQIWLKSQQSNLSIAVTFKAYIANMKAEHTS